MRRVHRPEGVPHSARLRTSRALFVAVVLAVIAVYGGAVGMASDPPVNDECSTATVVPSVPFVDTVDTTGATNNPADPKLSCNFDGNQTDGNTVWYVWTPPEDITVNISTVGSTTPTGGPLDTAHAIFTGSCGMLTEISCVDVGFTDTLTFAAKGGVTYYIKVGEFLGGVGGGNLVFTIDTLPAIHLESVRNGVSPPIGTVAPAATPLTSATEAPVLQEVPMFMKDGGEGASAPAAAASAPSGPSPGPLHSSGSPPRLLTLFNGANNDDNAAQVGGLIAPPDTDGDVGPRHYVQMTNLVTTIYDKTGTPLVGPFANTLLWTGLGGPCEVRNSGDPIVIYDEQRNRWLLTQFAINTGTGVFSLCIAASVTPDPTGAYYQHEFDFSSIGFPDYPKYGFTSRSISVMFNLFVPPFFFFGGTGLGAIDKAEAFSADPTTMVLFIVGGNEFGFLPGDNDGPVFHDVPPTFATNNGFSGSTIDFWEIHPDFHTPSNSTIGEVASIPVTPFDTDICPAFRERCIRQPGSGTGTFPNNITFLEAISDRLMHRLQIRNFGNDGFGGDRYDRNDHGDRRRRGQRALVNHTVDADGTGKAGVRWYEFVHDGRSWRLRQENTFSPDSDHRWMGSIAMNRRGQIALGYSISSAVTKPSIGVAAQTRKGHGSGVLDAGELLVFSGLNVQRQTSRWGDYSAMAVDPVDDTFWYTQEYAEPNSFIGERFGWATKIAQVRVKK